MNDNERLKAEARATVLKALAHPTRIYMVDLIDREGPHCVCDLTRKVGADTSTVSRHLAILKNAGILMDRKEGTTVYYSLACGCISEFMAGVEGLLRSKQQRDQAMFNAVLG
ncbi:MAG: ArsR/SmtB family transcription factor [Spirochaetaceae bacterium]